MCTLSWQLGEDGYTAFFNRDELKSRKLAETIRVGTGNGGIPLIYPVDGEKGGSWIAVNAYGVTTCLLNLYEHAIPAPPKGGFESRGWLVMQLADTRSWEEATVRLSGIDPVRYPPFHLVQIDPNAGVNSLKWTGSEVSCYSHPSRCEQPFSGSSYENDAVVAHRREVFRQLVVADALDERISQLHTFHNWSDPARGAYSVKMMRPEAQTMSLSRIDVSDRVVAFAYASRILDAVEFDAPTELKLLRVSHEANES